jgi:solute carrier family 50 protein (sugar transporter)
MVAAAAVLAVKIITGFTTMLVILSPCVALARVVKTKDIGSVSVLPLLLLLSSSHMWMMYGAIADLIFPVFSIFVVGEIAAVGYLVTYWRYAGDQRTVVARRAAITASILAIATLYAVLGSLGHTNQSHHYVVVTMGLMADIALVLLYGAPLEKVAIVLRTKSAACIQAPMVLAGTINNVSWLSYGILTSNWFIIGPNCLFITIHSFQLGLCIIFREHKQQPKISDEIEIVTDASEVSGESSPSDGDLVAAVQSPTSTSWFQNLASPVSYESRV